MAENEEELKSLLMKVKEDSGKGLHLAMTGEPRGFSRVAAGFSSYDGEFRMPLVLAHTHWKRPGCWEDLGQEEKGTTEDEMAG